MSKHGDRIREGILATLKQSDNPLTAYDVLEQMSPAYPRIAPTTIYRALAKLIERGCVHRIESLNAYIACNGDSHHADSVLAICSDCGSVDENVSPALLRELSSIIGQSGFAPTRHVIEVHGVCGSCSTEHVTR